jgi:hypothetical protein
LKPDVCRRVVGRLPSPRYPLQHLHAAPVQRRGMAPPFSLHFLSPTNREKEKKFMVVYLVRSYRTYARIRSLTTGTFNLVVKDRIAFRLSGAPSVQANPLQERIRLSSKPYKHIVRTQPCQRQHPTVFPLDFHMGNAAHRRAGPQGLKPDSSRRFGGTTCKSRPSRFVLIPARNDIAFRSGFAKMPISRHMPKRKTEN